MSKEWKIDILGNYCTLENGLKTKNEELPYLDVKYLRGQNSPQFKMNGNKVFKGDLLILVDGENSGELFHITEDGYMGSTFKKVMVEGINQNFLKNIIIQNKEFYKNTKTGSAIPHLNKHLFKNTKFLCPAIEEQEKIANLLSALDNKIEINNQINKDLEEIAQTLYTKWFVNFDFPNEEGNPYKSSGGEMIDSELGKIPVGWSVGKLGDLIIKNKDKIKNKEDWAKEKLMDLSNMPSYTMCLNEFELGEKLNSNIYKLNKYDILFGSIRPYLGKAGFAPFNGVVTGTVHSFSSLDKDYYSYVLCMVTRKLFFEYAIARSKGTKMPVVDFDSICDYNCLIPNKELVEKFNKIVFSYIEQIAKNIEESQELKKIRDLLLPYLMSRKVVIE